MRKKDYPQYEDLDLSRRRSGRKKYEIPMFREVPEPEILFIQDSDITLSTFVTVRGSIHLQGCRVVLNEDNCGGAFILESGSEFSADGCVFIGKEPTESPVIRTEGENAEISFNGCLFADCCSFVSAGNSADVSFNGCQIEDCYRDFAVCRNSCFTMNGSKILFTDNFDYDNRISFMTDALIYTDNCTGSMNAVQCVWNKKAEILLYPKGLDIENCYFQDMPLPVCECKAARESMFVNCDGAVGTPLNRHTGEFFRSDKIRLVENCDFFCCSDTIHNADVVKGCSFDSNTGTAVTTQFMSGFTVTDCHFRNLDGSGAEQPIICYVVGEKMKVTVEKCIFEDCNFGAQWGIGPKKDDVFIDRPKDPEVNINMCSFRNCTAIPELMGAFAYPGPLYKQKIFGSNKPVYGVIHITDCTGLNDDNPWAQSEMIDALLKKLK